MPIRRPRKSFSVADLLCTPAASLPKPPCNGDFNLALEQAYTEYLDALDCLDQNDKLASRVCAERPSIERLAQGILHTLTEALRGSPASAQRSLSEALNLVRPYLDCLKSVPLEDDQFGVAYRIRVSSEPEAINRGGMFHLPYQLRHRVSPQRYSMLGIPMLYLGSSTYVCWEELRQPRIEDMWISTFRLRHEQQLQVINFAYRPGYVARGLVPLQAQPQIAELIVAYMVIWPLLAACSFQTRGEACPFVVEYVIPQLLLNWLAEDHGYIGIRYFSTKDLIPAIGLAGVNYVFPASDGGSEGWSPSLRQLFELSEPLRGNLIMKSRCKNKTSRFASIPIYLP